MKLLAILLVSAAVMADQASNPGDPKPGEGGASPGRADAGESDKNEGVNTRLFGGLPGGHQPGFGNPGWPGSGVHPGRPFGVNQNFNQFGNQGFPHGGVNPAYPGVGGVNPAFPGVNPGFPNVGVNPGFPNVGVNPGFPSVHPGHVSPVVPVPPVVPVVNTPSPPSSCRYWCRTDEGQAYCCEDAREPQSQATVVKPGQCPPTRRVCPPTRFGPQPCSNDGKCGGIDKCCFDKCLEQHVCKPPLGFGR